MKIAFFKKLRKSNESSHTIKFGKKKNGVIYWTKPSFISVFFSIIAVLFIVIAVITASAPLIPSILYRVFPGMSDSLAEILSRPPTTFGDLLKESGEKETELYQPAVDPGLVDSQIIRIPKIGVDTEIIEAKDEDFESALRKGVWRVPDYGTPYTRQYPTILVAHRFGYLEWSNQYRRENSFFNLPKLSQGDRVEIIWQKRKYQFEIIEKQESEQITNYSADLIMYTCKYLQSSNRIFLYARLMVPSN